MPRYEVTHDGTDEALNPEGGNAKVSFNNDGPRKNDNTNYKRIFIIAIVIIFCLMVTLLCAYFVYRVFFRTVPQWQRDDFYIESIPGLRYGPPDKDYESTLIHFKAMENYKEWTDSMEEATKAYLTTAPNSMMCDYEKPPISGKVCFQDISKWFPCVKENHFGYHKATPCVFLRFNKLENWTAQYYTNVTNLPADMPISLKAEIARQNKIFQPLLKTVWVSCSGESPADEENIGPVHFIPRHGFPGFFFPYNNTANYLGPMIAVSFERPRPGVLIHVECRVWAPNIEYDPEKGIGFVRFQLLID